MSEIAAMLRDGESLADVAARHDVTPGRVQTLLNDGGWGKDGHPNTKPKPRPLFIREDDEQPWAEQALCAQIGGDAWFPDKGTPDEPQTNPVSLRDAKRVCLACPVRVPCLDYALKHDERFGVWGGLSERERRRLKRQREAS